MLRSILYGSNQKFKSGRGKVQQIRPRLSIFPSRVYQRRRNAPHFQRWREFEDVRTGRSLWSAAHSAAFVGELPLLFLHELVDLSVERKHVELAVRVFAEAGDRSSRIFLHQRAVGSQLAIFVT